MCKRAPYYRGQPRPIPMGGAPASPKRLGPPTCAYTTWEIATKFCMIDQTRYDEYFKGRPCTSRPWPKMFVTRKLTRDLFAVADLVQQFLTTSILTMNLRNNYRMQNDWLTSISQMQNISHRALVQDITQCQVNLTSHNGQLSISYSVWSDSSKR